MTINYTFESPTRQRRNYVSITSPSPGRTNHVILSISSPRKSSAKSPVKTFSPLKSPRMVKKQGLITMALFPEQKKQNNTTTIVKALLLSIGVLLTLFLQFNLTVLELPDLSKHQSAGNGTTNKVLKPNIRVAKEIINQLEDRLPLLETKRGRVVASIIEESAMSVAGVAFTKELDSPSKAHASTRFAYAYLLGGCDPDRPVYRNFLYNILVNTRQMRRDGSVSDVIILIQMMGRQETLPASDLRFLKALNISLQYIPPDPEASFETLMFEKFRVLEWTQYDRILTMDADIMLRGSLDYLMELSMQGTLKSNIVFAGRFVPAVGGLFILQPGKYDHFRSILSQTNTTSDNWDVVKGWGHPLSEFDSYTLVNGKKGGAWDFPGASMDQGLLYHWTKYEERSVSIVFKNSIENWSLSNDGRGVNLEATVSLNIFNGLSTPHTCWELFMAHKQCIAPHRDFLNFPGAMKPWLHRPPTNFSNATEASPSHFWYYQLYLLNDELGMGLRFDHWQLQQRPLLGYQPLHIRANPIPEVSTGINELGSTSELQTEVAPFNMSASGRKRVFAYAYVIGGCDPNEPGPYRNFIHNVLINTFLQRQEGSKKSDVIVFVQMAYKSEFEKLPESDMRVFNAMNIKIVYLPKTEHESFERLMFEKFRVLTLTQYKRVMFLDADIMIRGSLDYLFELSLKGIMKENMVIAGRREPAIGGLFMVTPKDGDWDQLLAVIRDKETRSQNAPSSKLFDDEFGWGHPFNGTESYEVVSGKKRNRWDFAGASRDQGLLYSWVRFEKKSVSIILKDKVQNWGVGRDGQSILEDTYEMKIFTSSHPAKQRGLMRECWAGSLGHRSCLPPISDYVHFPGFTKPWMNNGPPYDLWTASPLKSPTHFWFQTLMKLNDDLKLALDFQHWEKNLRPSLGVRAKAEDSGLVNYAASATKTFSSPYTVSTAHSVQRLHRFAYAYVIGGVMPEDPAYRSYFSDIIISTYIQREEGSQADVVVLVQMAYDSSFNELPISDLNLLRAADILVRYIPKAADESFYRLMMDKFRILNLTEYERVLYMDGDVMARGNLDYLFELSVKGVLEKNIVFAGQVEPASGGIFMLAPTKTSQDRILNIIREKEIRCSKLPYPHWDDAVGWGHVIDDDDSYELLSGSRKRKWNFYGAFADQGLLYHWVKYEEKAVSIVMRHEIQNWNRNEASGEVHLESILDVSTLNQYRPNAPQRTCWSEVMRQKPCIAPHSDYVHFTGRRKPWLDGPPPVPEFLQNNGTSSPGHFWFYTLYILNEKMGLGLDFANWRAHHRPSLGMFPTLNEAAETHYAISDNVANITISK